VQNKLKKGFEHLKSDRVMKFLIDRFKNKIDWTNRYNPNSALSIANIIIEQQISFKAAITVKKRFYQLTKNKSNSEIIKMPTNKIQSIGISFRKVEYIKNVFKFFSQSQINFEKMDDKDVIKSLISIKGVGEWTAQMFLIFNLYRTDVFSQKDLALINSIKKNYSLSTVNKEVIKQLTTKWSPFNSIASLLLWESIENQIFYSKFRHTISLK